MGPDDRNTRDPSPSVLLSLTPFLSLTEDHLQLGSFGQQVNLADGPWGA